MLELAQHSPEFTLWTHPQEQPPQNGNNKTFMCLAAERESAPPPLPVLGMYKDWHFLSRIVALIGHVASAGGHWFNRVCGHGSNPHAGKCSACWLMYHNSVKRILRVIRGSVLARMGRPGNVSSKIPTFVG